MKRILVLLSIVAMSFGTIGCGEKKQPEAQTPPQSEQAAGKMKEKAAGAAEGAAKAAEGAAKAVEGAAESVKEKAEGS